MEQKYKNRLECLRSDVDKDFGYDYVGKDYIFYRLLDLLEEMLKDISDLKKGSGSEITDITPEKEESSKPKRRPLKCGDEICIRVQGIFAGTKSSSPYVLLETGNTLPLSDAQYLFNRKVDNHEG